MTPTARALRSDRGSQSLELAMVVPAICLLLLLVVAAGQVVLATIGAHELAAATARLAAVGSDEQARAQVERAGAMVAFDPPRTRRVVGDPVTARINRPVRLVLPWPLTLDVAASVTMQVEDAP